MKKTINRRFTILALALLMPIIAWCQDDAPTADKTLSPYFYIKGNNSGLEEMPLKATSAEVNIAGVIADVVVKQLYINTGTKPIEALYVFPASSNAAVYGLQMRVGNRRITAKIREREAARQEYEAAKSEGKRATLLEQDRPNVFQMNIANIQPNDTIEVTLKYTELLVPKDGIYEFAYPTVVGPRYTGGAKAPSNDKSGFTASPYTHAGTAPTYTYGMNVRLAAGMPIQELSSPSHKILTWNNGSEAGAELAPTENYGGNRDFILRYKLKGDKIESGMILYEEEGEKFFLYMAQPPKRINKEDMPPREYIFVVDVSGSMTGFPLAVSKKLLKNLAATLRPEDKFNVILFAGTSAVLSETSLPATKENLEKAMLRLDDQTGSGGTELLPALQKALNFPRQDEGVSRSIVVVTDGYIDVEKESFELVRNGLDQANLFAFGIGSGVNRFLIEGLARVGKSEPFIVTNENEADAAAEQLRKYISSPILTQVKLKFKGFNTYDVEPPSIPDVLADRPVIVYGKYKGDANGKAVLTGYSAGKKYSSEYDIAQANKNNSNAALKYLWARERIKLLDDYNNIEGNEKTVKEVTELGLKYNLLTAYTSFIAIDETIVFKDKAETVSQPLPIPEGVSDSAIGFDFSLEGMSYNTKSTNTLVFILPFFLFAMSVLYGVYRSYFLNKKAIG